MQELLGIIVLIIGIFTTLYLATGYRRNVGEEKDERGILIDCRAAEKTILLIQALVVLEIIYLRFIVGDRTSPEPGPAKRPERVYPPPDTACLPSPSKPVQLLCP